MLDRSRSGGFITFTKEFEDVEEEVEVAIVDTRFCTHNLIKEDYWNDHPCNPKIMFALYASIFYCITCIKSSLHGQHALCLGRVDHT